MIAGSRLWAVVPVKRFATAKGRLASVLDAGERVELARLMFMDVLDAMTGNPNIFAGVLVVTGEGEAVDLARHRGATIVPDEADGGINAAIDRAIQTLDVSAGDGVVVMPSDIPQVTRNAFAQAAAAVAAPRSLAIAAAAEDGGTNLFACRPADVIVPRFGPRSFDQHCRAALEAGIAVQTLRLPELSLDIDRPENLRTFLTLNSKTRAHAFLSGLSVIERLERRSRSQRSPLYHEIRS